MGQRLKDRDGLCLCALAALNSGAFCLPVPLEGREFRGDIDVRVDARGAWHYNHRPITDPDLIAQFASMLKRDTDGRYWLVTPNELGRIDVDDAPLVAVDHCLFGCGEDQRLSLLINSDQVVCVDEKSPLVARPRPSGAPGAYVVDANGIEAMLAPAVHAALIASATAIVVEGRTNVGIWSAGSFFTLDPFPHDPFPLGHATTHNA